MDVQIRFATTDDAEIIADFNAAMAIETEHLELDRDRLAAGVYALLDDRAKGFYLVAESRGRVIAQTMVTYEFSDWRNATFWWIQSVYVLPQHRRRGVFRDLFFHVRRYAQQSGGVCGVRLYVERSNFKAQETYAKLGMRRASYEMYELDFVIPRK